MEQDQLMVSIQQFDTAFASAFSRGEGWQLARNAIATILTGLSITEPISASIKAVYQYRDITETDFPCVVMPNPPGKRIARGPSGYRDKLYVVELQVLAKDADVEREAQILDSLEEAIIDAFDQAVTLGLFSGFSIVEGPNWEPAGRTALQDNSTAGIAVGSLVLKMVEAKNYIG